jgi:Histidinol phosphatase and related hydrolases of the PHP family
MNKLHVFGDYHTHTTYSDGFTSVKDNIEGAIAAGLKEFAFTEHGFANPKRFAMTREKVEKQKEEILSFKELYEGKLTVLQGIEADLIGADGTVDLEPDDFKNFDVIVMGYHSFARAKSFYDWRKIYLNSYLRPIFFPSKAVIAQNTRQMIAAVKRYPIDILAHLNHLYKVDCPEVAKAAADYGTLVELNEKHFDVTHETFDKMLATGCNFVIDSDAHILGRIGKFDSIEKFLSEHDFDFKRIKNIDGRPEFRSKG